MFRFARGALKYLARLGSLEPRPIILMYHRVSQPVFDPWGLIVSPSKFRAQMRWIKAHREPLDMSDFVARLAARTLPDNAVAVTFDDGYLDNYLAALPILEETRVPATFFLATACLGSGQDFWWDELAKLLLWRKESLAASITVGEATFDIRFAEISAWGTSDQNWRAWRKPITDRQRIFLGVWGAIRNLSPEHQQSTMATIRAALGPPENASLDHAMSRENVAELRSHPLVSIGGHTRNHPALTAIPDSQKLAEITGSKLDCEAIARKKISGFAYPYGDFDCKTAQITRDAGFDWACSTRRDFVARQDFDLFDLPRVQVLDWSPGRFSMAIKIAR